MGRQGELVMDEIRKVALDEKFLILGNNKGSLPDGKQLRNFDVSLVYLRNQ